MTYDEAVEVELTPAEARREVKRHGHEWEAFVAEVGTRDAYQGQEVLDWLGY